MQITAQYAQHLENGVNAPFCHVKRGEMKENIVHARNLVLCSAQGSAPGALYGES